MQEMRWGRVGLCLGRIVRFGGMEGIGFIFGKRISHVKILKFIVVLLGLFIFYIIMAHRTRDINREIFRNDIKRKWSGIVVQKFHNRDDRIVMDGIEGLREISVTSCLYDSARIGDTIIKQMNTNNCTILRGRKIYCDCYYEE
jgi:hypothetical protein